MNPGDTNSYSQRILRATALPAPDPAATLCVLECDHCGHVYASAITDASHRKCRQCQHGAPGLPVPAERDTEPWTREDHLIAFTLYNQLPFGATPIRDPKVVELAALLGRSVTAVFSKLANFAHLDPAVSVRGIHGSALDAKIDEHIWNEFAAQPEAIAYESTRLLAQRLGQPIEHVADITTTDLPPPGPDRDPIVRLRVIHSFFRRRVLSAYEFRCCVTGLRQPDLLVASHIIPTDTDLTHRLNPRNALCLNPLHARIFDHGLMWIESHFTIRFSPKLRPDPKRKIYDSTLAWITSFEGQPLQLPRTFSPDPLLLRRHAEPLRPKTLIKKSFAPWGPI
jgi:putative restriction endonuclease